MFLNPDKPIATCVSENCRDCPAGDNIHCHFGIRDLLHFCVIAFPPFLLGAAGSVPGQSRRVLIAKPQGS